jgi:endonuclease/exonuclease/phosphatase family metal-dependent hydrolase
VAFTAVIPVIAAVFLRVWVPAVLAAAAAVALLLSVAPRAFGGPTEPQGAAGPELRVLAANMRLGKGSPQALIAAAKELDVEVLSVEELTPRLAQELRDSGIRKLLPHRALATAEGARGGAIYSRAPITDSSITRLPGGFPVVHANLAIPGAPPLEVVSVHTSPPTVDSWAEDLASLPAPADDPLRILAGDFNATLDHDAFRQVLASGYDDVAETLGDGLAPTWPVGRRLLPPLITIDHVLADPRIGIRDYTVREIDNSDHRAVFAALELPAAP